MKIDYVALWDAIKRDPDNPRAKDQELERQRRAARAARDTTRIRYRNTDESGGVAVEPEGEG